jgi:two-component system sensor histidine kinase/response regulator
MGGDIGAESTPGRGTTCWFTARFEKQPAPAAVAEESAAAPTGPLAGLRALVVDDNETSRRILRHQVRQWGMLEGSAADAGEALELLRHAADGGKPFHVALLDMNMPGPDGLALAREIKADPRIARTVLVVMTSLGHRLDAVTLEAAGIAAQFAKPVKQSQLFTSVLHLLSGERERAAAPRAATEERTLVSPGASSPSGAREGEDAMPRVVLAEDNEDNRRLAGIMLRRLGCHVEAVTTGQAVLEALGRAAWDLVFMDCQMPEMDGYEATRAIREHERESGAHIPIIALTASALKGSREKCLDAGMDDHVTKPFKIKSLEEILRRWLPQKLAARVTAVPAPPADADGHAEEGRSEATSVRLRLRELHAEMSSGELFERQIERFVSGAPARLDQMRAARSRGDAKSVAEAAHSFKGLVGFFGAPHLVALAEDIQERCGAGGLGDMGNLFAEFEVGLGDLLRLLREERDQHTVKEST